MGNFVDGFNGYFNSKSFGEGAAIAVTMLIGLAVIIAVIRAAVVLVNQWSEKQ